MTELTDDEMNEGRTAALDAILTSDAPLKILIAGPGTGKSHTFSKVLEQVNGSALVLSFLGNLVADLEASLGALAEVRTFHAYCRGRLHNMDVPGVTRGVDYFPLLGPVVTEDLRLMVDADIGDRDIDAAFLVLDESKGLPAAALQSGDYYNAVGHNDAVYRVLRATEADPTLLPSYAQLLVDEFQDFCPLEVEMLRVLSQRSPTLIVGDDDQALYAFKNASPEHIRQLAADAAYSRFELPFCSRCTAVLVDATHRVVQAAQASGLLAERLDKPYICFMPSKREASLKFPKIVHARCTVQRSNTPLISRYVAQEIGKVSTDDVAASVAGDHPTVLIIGPAPFNYQVYRHLLDNDVPNVSMSSRPNGELSPLDAYRRLIQNEDSRLGWRILLHHDRPPGWEAAVVQALTEQVDLRPLLETGFVDAHLTRVALVRRLLAEETLTDDEWLDLEAATGLTHYGVVEALGLAEPPPEPELVADRPTVVVTTLVGAKGLQAEHVYVVGVNQGHFPRSNNAITDAEVCTLLVALTRAKQSCTLLSCDRLGQQQLAQSRFVTWLGDLVETRHVNAAYFH